MNKNKEKIKEATEEWVKATDCLATQFSDKGLERTFQAESTFNNLLDEVFLDENKKIRTEVKDLKAMLEKS